MLDARIYTFIDLCKTGNLTRTAENLHITEPAVSHHLKYLENYYGAKLFTYRSRNFSLTPEGVFLRDNMLQISREEELVTAKIKEMSENNRKKITIGAVPPVGNYILPDLIARYSNDHPQEKFTVIINSSDVLVGKLKSGHLPGIIIDDLMNVSGLKRMHFCDQRVFCICAPEHRLAGKHVTFADISEETILYQEKDSYGMRCLRHIFREHHQNTDDFNFHYEMSTFVSLIHFLRYNLGITFAYESSVRQELESGQLSRIYIDGFDSTVSFSMAILPDRKQNDSLFDFLRFCRNYRNKS